MVMTDRPSTVAGLILAAGAATRFGSTKQLALLDGLSLVARAARSVAPVCDAGVLVITGANQAEVAESLAGEPVRCVYNPAWREGIGASIRQGMASLSEHAAAVLVALADQPGLSTTEYAALVEAWRSAPGQPAAAVYADMPGVPAVFPRGYWPRLASLQGDSGARAVLRALPRLTRVEMPAAAWDIDRPADLGKGQA